MESNVSWYSNMVFYGGTITGLMKWNMVNGVFGDVRIYPKGVSFNDTAVLDKANINMANGDRIYRTKTGQLLLVHQNTKSWDITCPQQVAYAIYPSTNTYGTHYRTKINYNYIYDIYGKSHLTSSSDCYLYDLECPYRTNNRPIIHWREYAPDQSYWPVFYFYQSLLLSIVDVEGNAISGASIVVEDEGGTEVFTKTCNADGFAFDEDIAITSATTTTITDSSKSWTINEHEGKEVYISSGTNTGMKKVVLSNTATTLTFHDAFQTACSVGDRAGIVAYLLRAELTRDPATYGDGNLASPNGDLWTSKTPHTVIISATGYQTKTMVLTMDRKQSQVVTLEKAISLIYPEGKEVYFNLDKTNSQNKIKWVRV